jgi:hypothetical protein
MWNKIRQWFADNEMQLTWFFIGNFAAWFIVDIGTQSYWNALFDAIIVAVNYVYRPR